jgi:phospholipid/cholesterol/gamma-HCH transport system permease protein
MPNPDLPALALDRQTQSTLFATGAWQVQALAQPHVLERIAAAAGTTQQAGHVRAAAAPQTAKAAGAASANEGGGLSWDITGISSLDHIGAQLLWNTWGRKRPARLALNQQHEEFFVRLEQAGPLALPAPSRSPWSSVDALRSAVGVAMDHVGGFIRLIGQLVLDVARFIALPQRGPWKELSANVFHTGYQALGITALVGFLIGVVLSYLSAQQLHTFGGDIYLVNILGMSIVRELGPLLAAILVAGRSGSAITAQLGVMRVTEELDAMLVMGLPHGFRLIMPRVLALAVAMPLLVVWTDAMALLGGMAAANLELGLSASYFIQSLPGAVPLPNYWIGLGKGVVFGCLIALVACHFGLRIEPDTESLGRGTTTSVVTAITIVILADAVFAIVFKGVGF